MTLDRSALERIAQETKASYEARAKDFWAGTRGHDVSQNIAALLRHIEAKPPLTILDLGCGPGRDLKIFSESGHTAIGVEGVAAFAVHAREYSGCDVWEQDLLRLELPAAHFDGIFANAVLFHVPMQELTRVLSELRTALKPGGVLFASNPHGHNEEGWTRGRYGAFLDHDTWRAHAAAAGFTELEHYYRPTGAPREQQPWLATVFRRSDPGVSAAA